MPKILILQGLPASGKSTFAKKFVKDKKDWVRINRDDLRNMRGDYWVPEQEDLITKWEVSCMELAMAKGFNIIMDSTNLNPIFVNRLLKTIYVWNNYTVDFKVFDTPVEVCIERDAKRESPVGAAVIHRMNNNFIKKNHESNKV